MPENTLPARMRAWQPVTIPFKLYENKPTEADKSAGLSNRLQIERVNKNKYTRNMAIGIESSFGEADIAGSGQRTR